MGTVVSGNQGDSHGETDGRGPAMKYTRYYADQTGASRTEEIDVEFLPNSHYAPPAPPPHLSPIGPATGAAFIRFPAGWAATGIQPHGGRSSSVRRRIEDGET